VPQPKRITVYSTQTCPYCDQAKAYLRERGLPFEDIDISQDRAGLRAMVTMTGQHGVPVIRVGEKAMVGWNSKEFQNLLTGQMLR
jgi:glutaredoxin 3